MTTLADRSSRDVPASAGRLAAAELVALARALGPPWVVVGDSLERRYPVADFATAVGFAQVVAAIADAEDHHPELTIGWGRIGVRLTTHDVGGLSARDFIVAAKVERAFAAR